MRNTLLKWYWAVMVGAALLIGATAAMATPDCTITEAQGFVPNEPEPHVAAYLNQDRLWDSFWVGMEGADCGNVDSWTVSKAGPYIKADAASGAQNAPWSDSYNLEIIKVEPEVNAGQEELRVDYGRHDPTSGQVWQTPGFGTPSVDSTVGSIAIKIWDGLVLIDTMVVDIAILQICT